MVPTVEAYRMAIRAMLGWIEKNMDLKKTRVFFSSMSPSHEKWVKQVNFFSRLKLLYWTQKRDGLQEARNAARVKELWGNFHKKLFVWTKKIASYKDFF